MMNNMEQNNTNSTEHIDNLKNRFKNKNLELIKKGGQVSVYKGILIEDTQPLEVAVKIMKVGAEGLSLERQIGKTYEYSLDHENLLKFHGGVKKYYQLLTNNLTKEYYEVALTPWMKYGDISNFWNSLNIKDLKILASLIIDVLNGLSFLHKTLVHRDISPDNILINDKKLMYKSDTPYIAKVTDIGIAVDRIEGSRGEYDQVYYMGKLPYMAPEQIEYLKNSTEENWNYLKVHLLSPKIDYWSLGAVIYELLSGKTLFEVSDFESYEYKVYKQSSNWEKNISKLPFPFNKICQKCLVINSIERTCDASELINELSSFINEKTLLDVVKNEKFSTKEAKINYQLDLTKSLIELLQEHFQSDESFPLNWSDSIFVVQTTNLNSNAGFNFNIRINKNLESMNLIDNDNLFKTNVISSAVMNSSKVLSEYSSPEECLGDFSSISKTNPTSYSWSFGVYLYKLYTGKSLFNSENLIPQVLSSRISNENYLTDDKYGNLEDELKKICKQLIVHNTANRIQDLSKISFKENSESLPPVFEPLPVTPKRFDWITISIIFLIILILLVLFYF